MVHVLVIEDDPNVQIALQDTLESDGHTVSIAANGFDGVALVMESPTGKKFELVLLDIMLPQMNGLEVCQHLRANGVEIPIIMLTARGEPSDVAFGLKLGADDYIPKPFDVGELLARVEAVLRRTGKTKNVETAQIGSLYLDFVRLTAKRSGVRIKLTPTEFEILNVLFEKSGETVSRKELLTRIWGNRASYFSRAIDAHINRLRQKIEEDSSNPKHIITVHRIGYRLIA